MVRKYWSKVKSKAINAISKFYSLLPNEKGLDGYALLSLQLTKHILLLLLLQCWFYFLSTALIGSFFFFFSQIYSTISQGLQQNSGFTLKTSFSGFLGSPFRDLLTLCLAPLSVHNYRRLHIHFAHVSFVTTLSSLTACFPPSLKLHLQKLSISVVTHHPFFYHQGISFHKLEVQID